MAIEFDNASSAVGVGVSTLTWTHTAGGANRFMVFVGATLGVFSAVSYNNVAFTERAEAVLDISFNPLGNIYTLTNNNTGALTAFCALTGGSGVDDYCGGMISYNNVSQANPLKTQFTATAAAATVFNISVSTTAENVVVAMIGTSRSAAIYTNPGTQNQRLAMSAGNVQLIASDKTAVGATTSLSWTSSVATVQFECAVVMSLTAVPSGNIILSLPLTDAGGG